MMFWDDEDLDAEYFAMLPCDLQSELLSDDPDDGCVELAMDLTLEDAVEESTDPDVHPDHVERVFNIEVQHPPWTVEDDLGFCIRIKTTAHELLSECSLDEIRCFLEMHHGLGLEGWPEEGSDG